MLFVGDDWAEDHHDVEILDVEGRRLVRKRLPEGLAELSKLHELIATAMPPEWSQLDPDEVAGRVKIGIETERGPWVAALVTAGYEVFAINPMSTARYRERHSTSGAKSDAGDAHVLAEIVRLDRAHHRPVAGDSDDGEALKLVTRAHQSLIWDRTRHLLRLRSALREYFPADAGTSPITRASGTKKVVLARYARNHRLADAVQQWAFSSMRGSPGARAYYLSLRARKIGHQAAIRQLANRQVGILHGCLKHRTLYDEQKAWPHHATAAA